jgi:Flp pilus assembly protein TadB
MSDHWAYVVAAYALAVVVLAAYWRRLVRKERELKALRTARADHNTARTDHTMRSRQPSIPAHPRSDPGKRSPLQ